MRTHVHASVRVCTLPPPPCGSAPPRSRGGRGGDGSPNPAPRRATDRSDPTTNLGQFRGAEHVSVAHLGLAPLKTAPERCSRPPARALVEQTHARIAPSRGGPPPHALAAAEEAAEEVGMLRAKLEETSGSLAEKRQRLARLEGQKEELEESLGTQVQHLKPYRVEKLRGRAAVANYLILPTKYSFPTLVRLYALVYTFVNKLCRNRRILNHLLKESKNKFQMFQSSTGPSPTIAMTVGREKRADSISLVEVFHPNSNWSLGWVSGRGSYAATQTIRGDVETVPTERRLQVCRIAIPFSHPISFLSPIPPRENLPNTSNNLLNFSKLRLRMQNMDLTFALRGAGKSWVSLAIKFSKLLGCNVLSFYFGPRGLREHVRCVGRVG